MCWNLHSSLLPCLNRLDQSRRGILTISLRVIANPSPEILADILEGEFSLPAQLLIRAGGVRGQVQDIAGSLADDLVFQRVADDLAERVDHLEDGAAASGPQVPGSNAGLLLPEVVQSRQMALGEINDVDVVADRCAVSGFVVFSYPLACS